MIFPILRPCCRGYFHLFEFPLSVYSLIGSVAVSALVYFMYGWLHLWELAWFPFVFSVIDNVCVLSDAWIYRFIFPFWFWSTLMNRIYGQNLAHPRNVESITKSIFKHFLSRYLSKLPRVQRRTWLWRGLLLTVRFVSEMCDCVKASRTTPWS